MKTNKCFETFPKRNEVKEFLKELKSYMYPNYFEDAGDDISSFKRKKLEVVKKIYLKSICKTTWDKFSLVIAVSTASIYSSALLSTEDSFESDIIFNTIGTAISAIIAECLC